MCNVGSVSRTSTNSIKLAILFAYEVYVNVVVARTKGQITPVRGEFDALNQVGAVTVNGNQLPRRGIKDDPATKSGRADDEYAAIG